MEWVKVSKEIIDKAPEIIPLKKGELQIKYAEALVKIDKAIEELNQPWGLLDFEEAKKEYEHKKKIISILQGEEAK